MKKILQNKYVLIGAFLLLIIGFIAGIKVWNKNKNKRKLKKEKVPVDKDLLLKNEATYKRLAYAIYDALKGLGTDESKLVPLQYLTKEELKMVFNAFNDVLIEKGDTDDGNIIQWLIDDGEEQYAQLFINAGLNL